jgi:hypothetical protein
MQKKKEWRKDQIQKRIMWKTVSLRALSLERLQFLMRFIMFHTFLSSILISRAGSFLMTKCDVNLNVMQVQL